MSDEVQESLVVVGGPAMSRVDTADLQATARRLTETAATLSAAAWDCLEARSALDRAVWTPAFGEPDPGRVPRLRWARDLAAGAADSLVQRARQCTSLGERLLVAAGLYRHAETAVEQVLGGLVATTTGVLSHAVTRHLADPVFGWPARFAGRAVLAIVAGSDDDEDEDASHGGTRAAPVPTVPVGPTVPAGVPVDDGGFLGGALRLLAPFVDEAVAGAAFGTTLGAPFLARGDHSVTGGARVLSAVVESVLPEADVEVEEVTPGEFAHGWPAWADRPAAQVEEAIARSGDLYPAGSGVPGRDLPGTPPGTVAVQKVTDADGSVSWVVTIPGTQELLSRTNPFDVDTDLDLMAHETADVMVGVARALEAAGADPDEPVVLIGHSLGGIAAVGIAASPEIRSRFRIAALVTVGAPTATFTTPPGMPVLHLENTEELVSPLDGRSSHENPGTVDRVTLGRDLADSDLPADVAASGSIATAHQIGTHLRTLRAARDVGGVGNVQVASVTSRIEPLLNGERAETRFYRIRRVPRDGG